MSDPIIVNPKRIVVAGANGFVGRALIPALRQAFPEAHIVALTRAQTAATPRPNMHWQRCDLFSLLDCEKALADADVAFYLVHSMLPSAHLDQGSFSDHDLILADNFARAAKKQGLKQIIYLGGLIPQATGLSKHLASRKEVEDTLSNVGIPLTTLRAGLIIGATCSSFTIVRRLAKRLPVLICPVWMRTRCQPIDISDVIASLVYVVGSEQAFGKAFDIGGPSILSYKNILLETARAMGKNPLCLSMPMISPKISRLWVSLVTGAPRNLAYPLIESLQHDMTVQAHQWLRIPERRYLSFSAAVDKALKEHRIEVERKRDQPQAFLLNPFKREQKHVRSVQRLILPNGMRARDVAMLYMHWLPSFLPWLIRVDINNNDCKFFLALTKTNLLHLEYSVERSSAGRQLFYIRGGILAKNIGKGRLEFREVLNGAFILAAVHEFHPIMPWYIYRLTQALLHLLVMRSFGSYLRRISGKQKKTLDV